MIEQRKDSNSHEGYHFHLNRADTRAHWQRCRLVPSRTEGGRLLFLESAEHRYCFISFVPDSVMATIYDRSVSNPLSLPEIVGIVVDNVYMVPDLLSCACVNGTWSVAALKKLYEGSLNDMQFRTPDMPLVKRHRNRCASVGGPPIPNPTPVSLCASALAVLTVSSLLTRNYF
jgi:hypothetical protein